RKFSPERIARTLRRVCGSTVAPGTEFTISEPPAPASQPVRALLSDSYRSMTLTLWVTYFMGLLVIYLLSGWLPTLINDAGLPIERAASIAALFQLGGTVGALVVGWYMDRRSANKVIALAYVCGAAWILLLATGNVSSALFSLYVLMAGFCMSGAQTGL